MLNHKVKLALGGILLIVMSYATVSAVYSKSKASKKQGQKDSQWSKLVVYPPTPKKYAKYKKVSFKLLADYNYLKVSKIPRRVKTFNKKKVIIEGFMLPVELDKKGGVKVFFLLKDQQMCCFGVTPQVNDYVVVTMTKPCSYHPDIPVRVYGQLMVSEKITDGIVESIYRMKGQLLVPPDGI